MDGGWIGPMLVRALDRGSVVRRPGDPPGLAFAAGATGVIVDELIPESHSHGNEPRRSRCLRRLLAMLAPDYAFG